MVSVEVKVGVGGADETGGLSPIKHDRSARIRRATVSKATAGRIEVSFMLKVPSTLIVCKSHGTDVGIGGVR